MRMGGVVALVVLGWVPANGGAQELTLSAGPAPYDLSGTGTSWTASVRYGHDLAGRLSLEAGLGVFRYRTQTDRDVTFALPELGVTVAAPVGPIALLFTAGGGYASPVEGRADGDLTLFGAVGLDLPARGAVRLRPSLRVRVVDPWVGTIGEYGLGVRFPLGS